MKRYKMNEANRVNAGASKSGIKWRYRGKFESIQKAVDEAKRWSDNESVVGVRVTDSESNEVVYEEMWR